VPWTLALDVGSLNWWNYLEFEKKVKTDRTGLISPVSSVDLSQRKQSERVANGAPRRSTGWWLPRARGGAWGGAATGGRAGGRGNSLDPTKLFHQIIPRKNCPFLRDSTTIMPPLSTCGIIVVEVWGINEIVLKSIR
jgi:hypothetical protein